MKQIAIIGDKETIFPFRALGFHTVEAAGEDVREKFKETAKEDFVIIFVTEQLVPYIEKEIEETMKKTYPIVTLIPSVIGTEETPREDIVKLIEKIVGPNLMKED